jgi:hypothetical protein
LRQQQRGQGERSGEGGGKQRQPDRDMRQRDAVVEMIAEVDAQRREEQRGQGESERAKPVDSDHPAAR